MQALAKDNQKYQSIFGQQLERYSELDEVTADVNLKKGMWEAKRDISSVTDSWRECLVMEMPVKEWDAETQKWYKIAIQKLFALDDYLGAERMWQRARRIRVATAHPSSEDALGEHDFAIPWPSAM